MAEEKNGSSFPVESHPLLSPSPTEPLGFPPSLPGISQPGIPTKNPTAHPLHHPPTNAWASPKHPPRSSHSRSSNKVLPFPSQEPPALNTPSTSTNEALYDAEFFNSKFGTSFCDEFERLFSGSSPWAALRVHASNSRLRNCRFRSLCWKRFLGCHGEDLKRWDSEATAWRRHYADLKRDYSLNPRTSDEAIALDLALNNPLSQSEDSPWSRYFRDNELKQIVWQDVVRTFPEIEFFQTEPVQKLMQDVLFVYAREHPGIEYRQGMHELLAPLVFVIHCDQQTCSHACEVEGDVSALVKTLLDVKHLEADAYALFCRVMEFMEPLYQYGDALPSAPSNQNSSAVSIQPFQDKAPEPDSKLACSSAINKKLRHINEQLLLHHDHELFTHLERLDIAPQIYGLRWVRLLFGREFPLQDLLILWDAIFADEAGFQLVDYLFVAMLEFLRDYLLSNDYTTCMRVLMKFPPVGDAAWFIKKAYNLRDPFGHPRPSNFSYANLLVKQKRAVQVQESRRASDVALPQSTARSSSVLTMIAGKQARNGNSSSDSNSKFYVGPSREPSRSNAAEDAVSSVSKVFANLSWNTGNDVITGGSKPRSDSNALFVNVTKKDARRDRAASDGTSTKKAAGVAQRVSAAEEALPNGGADGHDVSPLTSVFSGDEKERVTALEKENADLKKRVRELEVKLGDVGVLLQSCDAKMASTIDRLVDGVGTGEDAVENFKIVRTMMQEGFRFLGIESPETSLEKRNSDAKDGDAISPPEIQVLGREERVPASVNVCLGDNERVSPNCLDEASKEVLRSAMMDEAVEATESTTPPLTVPALSVLQPTSDSGQRGPSVSPSSDSSDYSMVDPSDAQDLTDVLDQDHKKL